MLQIAEALSLPDEFATQLASNQKLFSLACQVIRLSHKDEVRRSPQLQFDTAVMHSCDEKSLVVSHVGINS